MLWSRRPEYLAGTSASGMALAANPRTLQPAAVSAMPGSKSTASNRVVADGASRACGVERCGPREGCKVIGVVPWWRAVCTGGWFDQ